MAKLLRIEFDAIIDGLIPEALFLLREQCIRAEPTPANREIVARIDRRLIQFPGG